MKQAGWSSLGLCDEYDHLESFILFGHVLGGFRFCFFRCRKANDSWLNFKLFFTLNPLDLSLTFKPPSCVNFPQDFVASSLNLGSFPLLTLARLKRLKKRLPKSQRPVKAMKAWPAEKCGEASRKKHLNASKKCARKEVQYICSWCNQDMFDYVCLMHCWKKIVSPKYGAFTGFHGVKWGYNFIIQLVCHVVLECSGISLLGLWSIDQWMGWN